MNTHAMSMGRDGICTECGEWTTTDDPCCGAGVWSEGDVYTDDDDSDDEPTEGTDKDGNH